jgi:hypothetical protein
LLGFVTDVLARLAPAQPGFLPFKPTLSGERSGEQNAGKYKKARR